MKQAKKIRVTALFVALLCSLWFCLPALAALNGAAWATVTGQQAVLYLQGADQNAALQCQVGNTPVEVQQTRPLSELELPRQTVILLDNSLSIPQSQRTLVQTILGKVADNSLPGEQFTIATLSKDVNYLCQDQPDLATVKSVIDALQYSDQATQLSDGLYEVLQTLLSRQDGVLRRIILVSDGVDNKDLGYTREELNALIQQAGYPIYAIGCGDAAGADSQEKLENLFALARLTSGGTFYLQENQDPDAIASEIASWNNALQVTVALPDALCDGSQRMVQVISGDVTYTVSLTMPFATVGETPAPSAEPDSTAAPAADPAPEQKNLLQTLRDKLPDRVPAILLPVGAGILVIVLICVILLLCLQRRKKKPTFEHLDANAFGSDPALERTQLVPDTEIDPDKTALVWEDGDLDVRRLLLTDVNDASRRFEVPLQGTVVVGRDPGVCRVVIDYDPTVARHQCDIWQQGDQVMVRNQSKSNITQVNGQKVYGECVLSSGSTLKMGRLVLHVEIV